MESAQLSPTSASAPDVTLSELWFQLRRRWPWFVGSLLLAGLAAFLYLRVTPPEYAFRSTLLLGDQATGSKQTQELLQMLEVKAPKWRTKSGCLRRPIW